MIAIDTTLFIYTLNAHPEYGPQSSAIFGSDQEKIASELVFAEVYSSAKLQRSSLLSEAREFLENIKIEYIEITKDILVTSAELRRTSPSLKLADAIHLASALQAGADTFITNDQDLVKLKIKGLKIVSL